MFSSFSPRLSAPGGDYLAWAQLPHATRIVPKVAESVNGTESGA
jgi:hypothetical protein